MLISGLFAITDRILPQWFGLATSAVVHDQPKAEGAEQFGTKRKCPSSSGF